MSTQTDGMDKLKGVGGDLLRSVGDKAMEFANDKVSGVTDKLADIGGGGPLGKAAAGAGEAAVKGDNAALGGVKGAASGVKDKVTDAASGLKDKVTGGGGSGKGGKGSAKKPVNIYETIDVGVPIKVAYNQWTEYEAFTSFTRKVHKATAQADESPETQWGAKIFLSSREWKSTTVKQIPDERIVWESEGPKGYPNGSVTFHELSPTMTRIVLVIEYYPKGLFEKTGNIWRAQGRRTRSDFKQFPRHVMTRTILHADEVEGWRGTIEDKEIVETHEDALEREEQERQEAEDREAQEAEDQDAEGDEYEDEEESAEEEPEDELEEEEPDEDEAEDELEEEDEPAEEEPEDEVEEEEPAEEEPAAEDEAEEEPAEEEPEAELEEEEPAEEEAEEEPAEEKPKPRRRRKAS